MDLGKLLIITGIVLVVTGMLFSILPQSGFLKLPGDIYIKRDNFVLYFPVMTSIIISIILSFIIGFFFRK